MYFSRAVTACVHNKSSVTNKFESNVFVTCFRYCSDISFANKSKYVDDTIMNTTLSGSMTYYI
ncbi:unnamed protein product [Spodoptera exigua]|nr:unnamed protein product [Spodoptera exigua]